MNTVYKLICLNLSSCCLERTLICSKVIIKIRIAAVQIYLSKICYNLGLLFNTGLRFKPHINKCIQSANCKFEKNNILTDYLVLSHFNFSDVVYRPCFDKVDKDRIQQVQKPCL